MKTRELKIGENYYAFYVNKVGAPVYEGRFYYVGKGYCVRELSTNMKDTTTLFKFDILMPKDQAEMNRFTYDISEMHSNPLDWRVTGDNVEIKDIPPLYLEEFEWWNEFVEKHNLK